MWWQQGNTEALLEVMLTHANENESLKGHLNSHLIGAARQIGVPENVIRDAFESDDLVVLYRP